MDGTPKGSIRVFFPDAEGEEIVLKHQKHHAIVEKSVSDHQPLLQLTADHMPGSNLQDGEGTNRHYAPTSVH